MIRGVQLAVLVTDSAEYTSLQPRLQSVRKICMSWFSRISTGGDNSSIPSVDARERRRQLLEQERQQRASNRSKLQQALENAKRSREEANQACRDLLNLDPDIFQEDPNNTNDPSEIDSNILNDSSESVNMGDEFEDVNGTDGKSAMEGLKSVQCPYEGDDLEYWFTEFELQLTLIEVKSQWLKRLALQRFLPVEVRHEIKDLLKLSKTDAGDDIYFLRSLENIQSCSLANCSQTIRRTYIPLSLNGTLIYSC